MTEQERTEKLILEIAALRTEVRTERQFTAADFSQYLATHGVHVEFSPMRDLLEDMKARNLLWKENVQASRDEPGAPPRFRISPDGAALLGRLRQQAVREASAPLSANEQIAAERAERGMTICVSEKALDRWWGDLCDEMKADVFTTFLESFDESEMETA